MRDENGLYYEYLALSDPVEEDDGWLLYVVDLTRPYNPRGSPPELDAPLEVEAIFLNIRRSRRRPRTRHRRHRRHRRLPRGRGADDAVLVESFESLDRYQSITGASGDTQTTITRADVDNDRGRYAAQISFNYNSFATSAVGLRLRRSPEPLRVLASESFLDAIDADPGDTIPLRLNRQVLSVQITGSFELFPGFYPARGATCSWPTSPPSAERGRASPA